MSTWIIIGVVAIVGVLVFLVYRRSKKKHVPSPTAFFGLHVIREDWLQYQRPDGGHIIVVNSNPIPDDKKEVVLRAISDGLQRCIDWSQAHNPGWVFVTQARQFSPVLFIEPSTFNQDGSPALILKTAFGDIQTAGTVLNLREGNTNEPMMVLPFQPEWNYLEYLTNSVHYEAEHYREWKNDRQDFYRFAGANDVHPHWPLIIGLKQLAEVREPAFTACAGHFPPDEFVLPEIR